MKLNLNDPMKPSFLPYTFVFILPSRRAVVALQATNYS